MPTTGEGRLLRVCHRCGGVDDHPRQVIAGDEFQRPADEVINAVLDAAPVDERTRLLADLMDPTSPTLHYDCCALSGCSHDVCHQVAAAADGKTGKRLLALVTGSADPIQYRDDIVKGE